MAAPQCVVRRLQAMAGTCMSGNDPPPQDIAMPPAALNLSRLLAEHEQEILASWQASLKESGALQTGRIKEAELNAQCRDVLGQLRGSLQADGSIIKSSAGYEGLRATLSDISRSRALQG